jgi:hypothetical protein
MYDSKNEDAFIVHGDTGPIKFKKTSEGLYAYKLSDNYLEEVAATKTKVAKQMYVTTVKDNMEGFSKKQVENAKRARKLYHSVGCPGVENLKTMLRMNSIQDCPVTAEDVNNAERMFGKDIGALKGKTTRQAPPRVTEQLIEIPPELKERPEVKLAMDIMYVNDQKYLTSVDLYLRYRCCVPIDTRKNKEIFKALDVILRQYNKGQYRINKIYCDSEFKHMMDQVSDDLEVKMRNC